MGGISGEAGDASKMVPDSAENSPSPAVIKAVGDEAVGDFWEEKGVDYADSFLRGERHVRYSGEERINGRQYVAPYNVVPILGKKEDSKILVVGVWSHIHAMGGNASPRPFEFEG